MQLRSTRPSASVMESEGSRSPLPFPCDATGQEARWLLGPVCRTRCKRPSTVSMALIGELSATWGGCSLVTGDGSYDSAPPSALGPPWVSASLRSPKQGLAEVDRASPL